GAALAEERETAQRRAICGACNRVFEIAGAPVQTWGEWNAAATEAEARWSRLTSAQRQARASYASEFAAFVSRCAKRIEVDGRLVWVDVAGTVLVEPEKPERGV